VRLTPSAPRAFNAARAGLAALVPLVVGSGVAAQEIAFQEWTVPYERSRPRDPYVDAERKVWFVGQTADYVAVLDPGSGAFRRYELGAGTGPHNLIVDRSGRVWFAGNRAAHIGRLDPRDGSIVRYSMPDTTVRDPHTLVFDGNGDIWFTAQGGNAVGKLSVATGEVRLINVPTPRARPYGIVVDSRNRPWIVLFGTNKLATVDPATMRLTEHALPRAEARPRRLSITSDGAVWYGDYAGGMLGRFDPATGRVEEWPLPGGAGSRPYAMTVDDRDRIWIVETGAQPNRFVVFDARARRFVASGPVPSGGGTVRHMVYDTATRAVWFGTDVNTVGRAELR
jgi:virginiamycin B lyase